MHQRECRRDVFCPIHPVCSEPCSLLLPYPWPGRSRPSSLQDATSHGLTSSHFPWHFAQPPRGWVPSSPPRPAREDPEGGEWAEARRCLPAELDLAEGPDPALSGKLHFLQALLREVRTATQDKVVVLASRLAMWWMITHHFFPSTLSACVFGCFWCRSKPNFNATHTAKRLLNIIVPLQTDSHLSKRFSFDASPVSISTQALDIIAQMLTAEGCTHLRLDSQQSAIAYCTLHRLAIFSVTNRPLAFLLECGRGHLRMCTHHSIPSDASCPLHSHAHRKRTANNLIPMSENKLNCPEY